VLYSWSVPRVPSAEIQVVGQFESAALEP